MHSYKRFLRLRVIDSFLRYSSNCISSLKSNCMSDSPAVLPNSFFSLKRNKLSYKLCRMSKSQMVPGLIQHMVRILCLEFDFQLVNTSLTINKSIPCVPKVCSYINIEMCFIVFATGNFELWTVNQCVGFIISERLILIVFSSLLIIKNVKQTSIQFTFK